jgi:hypothetical protein
MSMIKSRVQRYAGIFNFLPLSDYHYNGGKYLFAFGVANVIHFYHFCLRGRPDKQSTLD